MADDSLHQPNQNMAMNPPQKSVVTDIEFLGEQDGNSEQEIKAEWRHILDSYRLVSRAYLAIVRYGTEEDRYVALCLSSVANEDSALIESLHRPFSKFRSTESLDIIFLTPEMENNLKKVCRTFFERAPADPGIVYLR